MRQIAGDARVGVATVDRVLNRVLLRACGAASGRYKPRHGETAASGLGEARSVLQGSAVHCRGDPVGGPALALLTEWSGGYALPLGAMALLGGCGVALLALV